MRVLGIIPARYASTRFPGKPLADLDGKSMIEWVYSQAKKSNSLDHVVVATDNQKIFQHASQKGCDVVMTSEDHISGTDRCAEVVTSMKQSYDYVINIQGDEPFIDPKQIDLLATLLNGEVELATLIKRIDKSETLFNNNVVKVVVNSYDEAIYFSRSPIPHIRNTDPQHWVNKHKFYKHIGMYAYRTDVLNQITTMKPTVLELAESLEQLRWLENGLKIKIAETHIETIGIDTPHDLEEAKAYLKKIS